MRKSFAMLTQSVLCPLSHVTGSSLCSATACDPKDSRIGSARIDVLRTSVRARVLVVEID